jgi:hypothetical protein
MTRSRRVLINSLGTHGNLLPSFTDVVVSTNSVHPNLRGLLMQSIPDLMIAVYPQKVLVSTFGEELSVKPPPGFAIGLVS